MDVGISFEENITVARFYWLLDFKSPTSTTLISALNVSNTASFSHEFSRPPHERNQGDFKEISKITSR